MSRIAELERRIVSALERIDRSAKALRNRPAGDPDAASQVIALRAALAKEQAANARTGQTVSTARLRRETAVGQLERRLARLTEQLDLQSLEMLRLKRANARLIESNAALREAQLESAPESVVLNRSLAAELDALQAERRAEMAEMEAILSELRPLVSPEEAHV